MTSPPPGRGRKRLLWIITDAALLAGIAAAVSPTIAVGLGAAVALAACLHQVLRL